MSSPARPLALLALLAPMILLLTGPAVAADLDEAEALFRAGQYDECARMAAEEIAGAAGLGRALANPEDLRRDAAGQVREAMDSLERAMRRFPASVSLRLLARDVYRFNGRQEDVPRLMEDAGARRHGLAPAVRHARGPRRAGPLLPPPRRRFPQGARPLLRPGHQGGARPGRGLPRDRRAGPGEAGRRPRRGDPPQGAQGRRRRTRASTTCWPAPTPTRIRPARTRSSPRRSRSTRTTSTACCSAPTTWSIPRSTTRPPGSSSRSTK